MSVTTRRAVRLTACAACAWLVLGCGHKKHGAEGVSAGGDGAMPLEDAGMDAAITVTNMPPPSMKPPPRDAGHDATQQGGGGTTAGDEDAGPSCDHSACRATGDDCNPAHCDPATHSCAVEHKADGAACGSRALDNCTAPDSCVSGVCVPNDSPKGTPCGDQGKDCNYDDACDGKGSCVDKGVWSVGTACGDQTTNTACDATDTCDASGVCQQNYALPNAPCGDQGKLCSYDDACDGQGHCVDNGVWTLGHCPAGSKDEAGGCLCGNDILNICQFAVDTCVDGTCVFGREVDGKPCGDTTTNTECDKPDACLAGLCSRNYSQPGAPCGDMTNTACNHADTCDGTGACQSNIALAGSACGDQGVACHYDDTCDGSGGCTDNGLIPQCP